MGSLHLPFTHLPRRSGAHLLLFGALLVAATACRSKGAPAELPSASASASLDQLAPGEVPPGRAQAYGILLPEAMRIAARAAHALHAEGPLTVEELTAFVKRELQPRGVELQGRVLVYRGLTSRDPKPVALRVEIRQVARDRSRLSFIVEEPEIPPPVTVDHGPVLTDEQRWKAAGYDMNGKALDPSGNR